MKDKKFNKIKDEYVWQNPREALRKGLISQEEYMEIADEQQRRW